MSIQERSTKAVHAIILALVAEGSASVRPGDVNTVLRQRGMPMGTWEVRAEFTRLEALGLIEYDADSAEWRPTEGASLKNTG